ncbi:MAG: acylphosphatase [Roseobacter sp.]
MIGAELHLTGQLTSDTMLAWICHRARLLDLRGSVAPQKDHSIKVTVMGPEALIDAMEVACLLGPQDVWVAAINRTDIPVDQHTNGFVINTSR